MAEINETGYISLRTLIVKEWNKLSLLDESDNEVVTVDLDETNWTHERDEESVRLGYDDRGRPVNVDEEFESNSEMKIEVVIKGSDVGALPATVTQSTIKENYSINDSEVDEKYREVSREQFQPFTFESVNDELTITHTISVPVI